MRIETNRIVIRDFERKDAENLYIIAKIDEPEMARLKFSKKEDAPKFLWEDALFEIFLNPSGDYKNYYQIVVHPSGYFQPRVYPAAAEKKDMGVKVRTYLGKDFWSAEIKLPLSSMSNLKDFLGDIWGMNFCRVRRTVKPGEYSCWSPTFGDFNRPERFGRVVIK